MPESGGADGTRLAIGVGVAAANDAAGEGSGLVAAKVAEALGAAVGAPDAGGPEGSSAIAVLPPTGAEQSRLSPEDIVL